MADTDARRSLVAVLAISVSTAIHHFSPARIQDRRPRPGGHRPACLDVALGPENRPPRGGGGLRPGQRLDHRRLRSRRLDVEEHAQALPREPPPAAVQSALLLGPGGSFPFEATGILASIASLFALVHTIRFVRPPTWVLAALAVGVAGVVLIGRSGPRAARVPEDGWSDRSDRPQDRTGGAPWQLLPPGRGAGAGGPRPHPPPVRAGDRRYRDQRRPDPPRHPEAHRGRSCLRRSSGASRCQDRSSSRTPPTPASRTSASARCAPLVTASTTSPTSRSPRTRPCDGWKRRRLGESNGSPSSARTTRASTATFERSARSSTDRESRSPMPSASPAAPPTSERSSALRRARGRTSTSSRPPSRPSIRLGEQLLAAGIHDIASVVALSLSDRPELFEGAWYTDSTVRPEFVTRFEQRFPGTRFATHMMPYAYDSLRLVVEAFESGRPRPGGSGRGPSTTGKRDRFAGNRGAGSGARGLRSGPSRPGSRRWRNHDPRMDAVVVAGVGGHRAARRRLGDRGSNEAAMAGVSEGRPGGFYGH